MGKGDVLTRPEPDPQILEASYRLASAVLPGFTPDDVAAAAGAFREALQTTPVSGTALALGALVGNATVRVNAARAAKADAERRARITSVEKLGRSKTVARRKAAKRAARKGRR